MPPGLPRIAPGSAYATADSDRKNLPMSRSDDPRTDERDHRPDQEDRTNPDRATEPMPDKPMPDEDGGDLAGPGPARGRQDDPDV